VAHGGGRHAVLWRVSDVHCLIASAALTWIMVMVAAELRTPTWTSAGAKLAFGNREALPEATPIAARADRAAKNMVENMVVFTALVAAARFAGADASLGATVFLAARIAYFAVYLAGIAYVRSAIWAASLLGMLHIAVVAAIR
jgi:uncharacterized MAPEG superfamily protein